MLIINDAIISIFIRRWKDTVAYVIPNSLLLECSHLSCMCVCVCVCVCTCSVVSDSVTPWTVACQALLSMEFSRQEYWNGLPLLLQGSSQHRDWIPLFHVSCIGRQILYYCATWEAPHLLYLLIKKVNIDPFKSEPQVLMVVLQLTEEIPSTW